MSDNQLDLTNFPTILPPDDAEDIEKRSEGITQIRGIAENLISAIQAYISDLQSFDAKAKLLEQQSFQFKEKEYELLEKEKRVYALEDSLNKEKEYIVNANKDLKERESKILAQHDMLSEIEESKKEWENRKTEALSIEKTASEKLKLIVGLNKKQQQLDEQQAVIDKEKEADVRRKAELDKQERDNKSEAARLQAVAERLSKLK